MYILTILCLFILGHIIAVFTEKSDHEKMKEAQKLPPFTKEEAENYYYNELRGK